MRKTLFAAALAGAFTLPTVSNAQTTTASATEAAPAAAPAAPVTANIGVFSEYRFRGIGQTFAKPAIQGGFDYVHASGFYLGNWNSNVSETAGYPGGNLEMDFYGGWKNTWNDWGMDVGLLYYYYPGSNAAGGGAMTALANPHSAKRNSGTVHNTEVYIAGSWKFISLKYSRATTDYFMTPDTKGSGYLDLSANYDLGNGWGINGHVGHTKVKNYSEASYSDYKVGVTKDVGGFVFGLSYVSTNARDSCATGAVLQPYCLSKNDGSGVKTYESGKGVAVLSVSRTF